MNPPGTQSPRLLTAEDVAATIGMSVDWIYEQVRRNRIPHVRLGRYVRFRRDSLEEWILTLERGTMPAPIKRRGAVGAASGMASKE